MGEELGPSRQFPAGKLCREDNGELIMGMAIHGGTLIINFGTPVAWIGLDLAAAEEMAEMLDKYIGKLRGLNG